MVRYNLKIIESWIKYNFAWYICPGFSDTRFKCVIDNADLS